MTFLIRDRDTKHTTVFEAVFGGVRADVFQIPFGAPRANATVSGWQAASAAKCSTGV